MEKDKLINELAEKVYYYKRECRYFLNILIFGSFTDRKRVKKYYKEMLKDLDAWFERQKKLNSKNYLERIE